MILFYLLARMPGAQLLCLLAIDILFLFLNLRIMARACFLGTISQKVGFEIVLPLLLWVMCVSVEHCLSTPVIFGFLPCSLEISGVSWPLGSLPSSSAHWWASNSSRMWTPGSLHASVTSTFGDEWPTTGCLYVPLLELQVRERDQVRHRFSLWGPLDWGVKDKFKVWGVQEPLNIMPKCVFMHFSGHEGP